VLGEVMLGEVVVEVPVCVPIPGLGVTVPVVAVPVVPVPVVPVPAPVPVVCAAAMPTDNASTDEANKILRIEFPLLNFCG
jgi:hypothetical protein